MIVVEVCKSIECKWKILIERVLVYVIGFMICIRSEVDNGVNYFIYWNFKIIFDKLFKVYNF